MIRPCEEHLEEGFLPGHTAGRSGSNDQTVQQTVPLSRKTERAGKLSEFFADGADHGAVRRPWFRKIQKLIGADVAGFHLRTVDVDLDLAHTVKSAERIHHAHDLEPLRLL